MTLYTHIYNTDRLLFHVIKTELEMLVINLHVIIRKPFNCNAWGKLNVDLNLIHYSMPICKLIAMAILVIIRIMFP